MTSADEAVLPGPRDVARVGSILAAQTRFDLAGLLAIYGDLATLPDAPAALFRLICCLAEQVVTGLRLRDDEELFQSVLADLARFRITEGEN
jgi:hypothetical protein